MTKQKLNAGHVEQAIRRHLNPFQNTVIPECAVRCPLDWKATAYGGYENWMEYRADYLSISGSDYATEIEVKVSRSDWMADISKPKWPVMPKYISKFIYCVPEYLGIPDFVPEWAGVWHVRIYSTGEMGIVVVRAPKRIGKEKVPADVKARWLSVFYHRYWHQRIHASARLPKAQKEERGCDLAQLSA